MNSLVISPEKFLTITANELMIEEKSISLETSFRDIATWSSLSALLYVSRINDETNILISSTDLAASRTLNDLFEIIVSRIHGTI